MLLLILNRNIVNRNIKLEVPSNISKNLIKPSFLCKNISRLGKKGVLLPVLLLEGTVIAGRTYHAYKRDGYIEARERFTEESISSVVWLWGVAAFNKIGDFFGKKVLNLPEINYDVGKDELRDPIFYVNKKNPKFQNILAPFKFTKIAASVVAATAITGFILPKFNQAITKDLLKKSQNTTAEKTANKKIIKNKEFVPNVTFEKFKKSKKAEINFKGLSTAELFAKSAYNLENNAVCRLLSTDAGLIGGRAYNARNKHDRLEILVRDVSSVFFYMFSTGLIVKFLNNRDKYKSIAALDPMAAVDVHNHLIKEMKNRSMTPDEFKKIIIGSGADTPLPKEILSKIQAENGVINLSDLIPMLKDDKLIKKAEKMAELQPRLRDKRVLSLVQVQDVFNDGKISSPEFLKELFNNTNNGKLIEEKNFISKTSLERLRSNVYGYVDDIVKFAQNSTQKIDANLLKKINSRNITKNGMHIAAGLGISALFLSTIIPKVQYYITKLRTGVDRFPGIVDYNKK